MSKSFTPTISEELHKILIDKYIEKRQEQIGSLKKDDKYITTRSLLALIRLCQAKVKIYLYRQDSDFQMKFPWMTSINALNSWKKPRKVSDWRTTRENLCMTSHPIYSKSSKICASIQMVSVLNTQS